MEVMRFRFPDDPSRVSQDELKRMDSQWVWLAQMKSDGWRRPGYLMDGDSFPQGCPLCPLGRRQNGRHWHFYAKRGTGEEAAKQPPRDLVEELEALDLPSNTALDMEWMGPRMVDELHGRHEFRVFDIHYMQGAWLGEMTFPERYARLEQVFAAARAATKHSVERVRLVPVVSKDLVKFFEAQKSDPLSEGLVLRHAKSKLVGDLRSPASNRLWRKVKYRDIKEQALI